MDIHWIIVISFAWVVSILWVIFDARKRKLSWILWAIFTAFFWIIPYALYMVVRLISRLLLRIPLPPGLQIIDRYIYIEILKMTTATVVGIAFIILANNIYTSADMFAQKKEQAVGEVPLYVIAYINLLDTPALVVLAFPVASLIGVMLALGMLGQGGEVTAIRTGGISLQRLILPVIVLSLFFSWFTYYLSQAVVPWCGEQSTELKNKYILGKEANIERHALFKYKEQFIYAARFDTRAKVLTKITVFEQDNYGLYHILLAYTGSFEDDDLVMNDVRKYILDGEGELQRYEIVPREVLPFPRDLQLAHETKRDAFSYAAGDLATKIERLEEVGQDPLAAKIDRQFQISVPLACTIFAFVGFMFSIFNQRKEVSVGVLYAILFAFVYYVFMAVIRSLAKQDQEILQNEYVAAWLTNFFFLLFGFILFAKSRR